MGVFIALRPGQGSPFSAVVASTAGDASTALPALFLLPNVPDSRCAVARRLGILFLLSIVTVATIWAAAAVWFDAGFEGLAADAAAAAVALAALVVFLRVRPLGYALAVWGVGFAIVLTWWTSIAPSNDRDWLADVARLPRATFDGDVVTIENVRDFRYRSETDYDPVWETRTYDLSRIDRLDLFLIYWGSPYIAHTILSWGFDDGRHLAISIETRKEKGESYSAVRGFFRQFELYYVVADERDVIGLRTDFRGEDVYLYRFRVTPQQAAIVLRAYLDEINHLAETPQWYNAMTLNCTTAGRRHTSRVATNRSWDWRILVNGYLDRLAYERGTIDTSLPFEALRRRSNIVERANAAGDGDDFSNLIRQGLPD
jgi:hypothetical protein